LERKRCKNSDKLELKCFKFEREGNNWKYSRRRAEKEKLS
jgi:hypothetical protein